MSAFRSLAEIAPRLIWPGILARVVEGRAMTFAVVELAPGAVAASHQHPHEQAGVVLQGLLRFQIAGVTRDLRAGDTYLVPGDTPHDATAGPEGAVVIDLFAPARTDWQGLPTSTPQTPRWPA